MKQLILGGVRSGKSAIAERLAKETGKKVFYIATAITSDDEMTQRVQQHKQRRPEDWQLIEESQQLATVLTTYADKNHCLLVDCLTLWLVNMLNQPEQLAIEKNNLLVALPTLTGDIIMVSNETGMGVVPVGEISRQFLDHAGTLHQQIAAQSERVILSIAGLPHILKGTPL